jgi:hypothetical protein
MTDSTHDFCKCIKVYCISVPAEDNFGIFFLVSGILQLFWVIPMVKRWGKPWYLIGIGGTVASIIIWAMTRVPNPITGGRALPINSMSIVTEIFEFAFIIITAIIILTRQERIAPKQKEQLRKY